MNIRLPTQVFFTLEKFRYNREILSYQRLHIWKCMVGTLSNFRAYKVIYGRKFRPYNCYTAGTLNRLICSSERQALPVFSWSQKGGGSASETSGLVMNKYLYHIYKYVPWGGLCCVFLDLACFHGPLPAQLLWIKIHKWGLHLWDYIIHCIICHE